MSPAPGTEVIIHLLDVWAIHSKAERSKQNVMWGRQYSRRGHARAAVGAEASAQQQTDRISG